MLNEVTPLINTLNSYITCSGCQATYDIEVNLKCGHIICKECKVSQTKCPSCYSHLTTTRENPPSVKFITDLFEEFSKVKPGNSWKGVDALQQRKYDMNKNGITNKNINCIEESVTDRSFCLKEPSVEDKLKIPSGREIRKFNEPIDSSENTLLKQSSNFKEKANEESDNDILFIGELRTNNKEKNKKLKKKVVFYGNYSLEDREIHKKILHDFGIEGIDKVKNGENTPHLNASEIEWNGKLNTIMSRLNYQNGQKWEAPPSVMDKRNSLVLVHSSNDNKKKVNVNLTNNFKESTDLKRKHKDDDCFGCSNYMSNSKCKRLEDETQSAINCSLNAMNKEYEILLSPDKKLGGIVDENEIVLRYLDAKKEIIENSSNQSEMRYLNEAVSTCNTSNSKLSVSFNTFKTTNVNNEVLHDKSKKPSLKKSRLHEIFPKKVNLKKSEVITISSDLESIIRPHFEEELQSDIIADMLNNVNNEIIFVGDSFQTRGKVNSDSCSSSPSIHSHSHDKNNKKVLTESPKNVNCVFSGLNKNNSSVTDNKEVILVSDSDNESESDVKKNKISSSFQQNSKTHYFSPEKEISIKNCQVIIENFTPALKKIDSNVCMSNCANKYRSDSVHNLDNMSPKKKSLHEEGNKNGGINCDDNLSLPKILEKPSPKGSFVHQNEGFEGFTEQDILILTVKLALFKMNGGKYSDNLCDSSLYTLDGKQILIKDVTGEQYMKCSSLCKESSKSVISSSVQTDHDTMFTPSPGTSRIRPVSIAKLCGLEKEIEKFERNDILDTSDPVTPDIPLEQKTPLSTHTPLSSVNRSLVSPISRRQLSFMSPAIENSLQSKEESAGHSKDEDNALASSSNDDWRMLHYRMQYMMPSCHEEALHNESERLGFRPTRLTFTTCGLNGKETALVTKLAQMTKSCLTKDFTHDTTHLIIGATGRGTLEYYLAIAYRAFIVTMEWVSLCIAFNKILPVTGFIPTEDEGPLKCLEPISPPFVGFYVCSKVLHGASTYPIADITKTLLSLGGARLLPEIDNFNTLQDGHFPRFFVYGKSSQISQAVIDKCASLHVVPVQFTWVYECVSAFRALPIMDFLGTVIHSRTLIRDYKVPEQLACSRYPRLEGEFHPQILDERYQRSL